MLPSAHLDGRACLEHRALLACRTAQRVDAAVWLNGSEPRDAQTGRSGPRAQRPACAARDALRQGFTKDNEAVLG